MSDDVKIKQAKIEALCSNISLLEFKAHQASKRAEKANKVMERYCSRVGELIAKRNKLMGQ